MVITAIHKFNKKYETPQQHFIMIKFVATYSVNDLLNIFQTLIINKIVFYTLIIE